MSTATHGWATPEAAVTYLTTELNGLASSTSTTTGFSNLGSTEIDNSVGLYKFIDLQVNLDDPGASSFTAGGYVSVIICVCVDGTNYDTTGNTAFTHQFLVSLQVSATSTALQLSAYNVPIPPLKFKLGLFNLTGLALNNSSPTNTLKYRRHNELTTY